MIKLSDRLQLLFDLSEGAELWDIGADHGLLGFHNLHVKKFVKVHCVDRSGPAIERLRLDLRTSEQMESMEVLLCDGRDLNWSRVRGAVVIAGVGTHTIIQIVKSCPRELREDLNWVLAPQKDFELLCDSLSSLFRAEQEVQHFEVTEGPRVRKIIKIRRKMTI